MDPQPTNQTHPNAFREEAKAKRASAANLLNEADELELQADNLEGKQPGVASTPAPAAAPSATSGDNSAKTDKSDKKK